MEYTIDGLRNKLFEHVLDVYDIFKNHFGEDYVDLQYLPSDDDLKGKLHDFGISSNDNGKYDIDDTVFFRFVHHYNVNNDNSRRDSDNSSDFTYYYNILVWFPKVTVTNEYDKSIDIQDLYAKVTINFLGQIPYEYEGFKFNRTTYTSNQWESGYLHSHTPSIPKSHLDRFLNVCLGDSSVKDTVKSLKDSNDPVTWMIFCEELEKSTSIESVAGVPYYHLEDVGTASDLDDYENFYYPAHALHDITAMYYHFQSSPYYLNDKELRIMLRSFTGYYARNGHLHLSYDGRKYVCGMQYFDYMIDVSNSFINFYNEHLKEGPEKRGFLYNGFLLQVVAANRQFKLTGNHTSDYYGSYIGTEILTFKGEVKRLNIINSNPSEVTVTTILNRCAAMFVLMNILKIINFRYKNDYFNTNSGTGSSEETPSPAHQTAFYI